MKESLIPTGATPEALHTYESEQPLEAIKESMHSVVLADGWQYGTALLEERTGKKTNHDYTLARGEFVIDFEEKLAAFPEAQQKELRAQLALDVAQNRIKVLREAFRDVAGYAEYQDDVKGFLRVLGASEEEEKTGKFKDRSGYYSAVTIRWNDDGPEVMVPASWQQHQDERKYQPLFAGIHTPTELPQALLRFQNVSKLATTLRFDSALDLIQQLIKMTYPTPGKETEMKIFKEKLDKLNQTWMDAEIALSKIQDK